MKSCTKGLIVRFWVKNLYFWEIAKSVFWLLKKQTNKSKFSQNHQKKKKKKKKKIPEPFKECFSLPRLISWNFWPKKYKKPKTKQNKNKQTYKQTNKKKSKTKKLILFLLLPPRSGATTQTTKPPHS